MPALDDPILVRLEAPPAAGQTQEKDVGWSERLRRGRDVFTPYALQVTLSNPYTFRATALANVTGLLAAIALFALGLSVVVSAVHGAPVHDPAPPPDRGVARPGRGRPHPARATDRGPRGLVRAGRARGPVQRDGRPAPGERRDHPPRPRPQPRLPGRRLARAADAAGRPSDVQRAADRGRRRRPGGTQRIPRVERPADRAARLAGPEPARAVQARFGTGAARPAAGRPARGGRIGGRAEPRRGRASRRHRQPPPARRADPDPARPAARRPGRGQPGRQRDQVHGARRVGLGRPSRRRRMAPGSR